MTMRFFKGGILLLLLMPALAMAQVSASVESIGIASYIRPNCWIPMVVTVTPDSAKYANYQIHVKLQDLDRDLPIYQRRISVTGAADAREPQRFRMYFMPPPTEGGLPDASDTRAIEALKTQFKVSIYTDAVQPKWICDAPFTGTSVRNVDPKMQWGSPRGTKLILAVTDGRSRVNYSDPKSTELLGVNEDVIVVTTTPRELPENILGYDAIDGMIWLDADLLELKAAGDEKFRAIETYVRRGGNLVICQPAEWQKTLGFGELLPVTIDGIREKDDLQPLRDMAKPRDFAFTSSTAPPELIDPFAVLSGPFRFAVAKARPGTVVGEWIAWKGQAEGDPTTYTPYLVRAPVGLGMVTWVAQDLGDAILTRTRFGWINVWDRVFDWHNSPMPITSQVSEATKRPFANGTRVDIGVSLIRGMDLEAKSAGFITLAVLFFIAYWVIAGPGIYAFLAARKKAYLSWFAFGLCAVLATGLNVLVVKLLLGGPPELKHFSIVRSAPDQPAVVTSRFGLYIPRDDFVSLQLKDVAPGSVTSIAPFPMPPSYLRDEALPKQTGPEYPIPVIDAASGEAASLSFKYRRTLKKFQATWVGNLEGTVEGRAKLLGQDYIEGRLTNATGRTLRNVFLVFNYPGGGLNGGDWILYIPSWDNTVTIDLRRVFNYSDDGTSRLPQGLGQNTSRPNFSGRLRGRLNFEWKEYLYSSLSNTGIGEGSYDDYGQAQRKTLLIMSLFDRITPMRNSSQQNQANRVDLLRRGGRLLDMSQAVAAGELLILAEAEGPLPMHLDVEGTPVTGTGLTLYQFVVPLDRTAVSSTTQPSGN